VSEKKRKKKQKKKLLKGIIGLLDYMD